MDGLSKVIGADGRIHTCFQNTVTATGRLSSAEPNLQNIPVRTELGAQLRKMFVAGPGKVLVDGIGVGDVGSVVMRDRKHLAQDGMIVVVMSMSGEDGSLVSGPDLITRGFVYVKESEGLMEELRQVALEAINSVDARYSTDWSAIKGAVKGDLSNYLYKKTKRSPMILPVIMEV